MLLVRHVHRCSVARREHAVLFFPCFFFNVEAVRTCTVNSVLLPRLALHVDFVWNISGEILHCCVALSAFVCLRCCLAAPSIFQECLADPSGFRRSGGSIGECCTTSLLCSARRAYDCCLNLSFDSREIIVAVFSLHG